LQESKAIILALRRKIWHLLINWSIYPIDVEDNISKLLQTLESLKEHRRFHPNVSNNLEIELEAFTSNLTLKNQRIVWHIQGITLVYSIKVRLWIYILEYHKKY